MDRKPANRERTLQEQETDKPGTKLRFFHITLFYLIGAAAGYLVSVLQN